MPMDYKTERENNIIKNIAKEIVAECMQNGFEVTQELAHYVVKLKLLNPRNGFTASEVMPRSLTQQLVLMVAEELKQDTPAMNCLRMQVYWSSINLNVAELKKEYVALMAERSDSNMTELLNLEREDSSKFPRLLANYTLVSQNLGSVVQQIHVKETVAAVYSVLEDNSIYYTYKKEQKIDSIRNLSKKVTGVRLYLKYVGKTGEGIEDVKTLSSLIETWREEISKIMDIVTIRIRDIRNVISSVVSMDYFEGETPSTANIYLPPECDLSDLKYLKQILVIMLQHNVYLCDLASKLDEIDGNAVFYLNEYDKILQRLQDTIRDREAVPTFEVYDDFIRASELWEEIQSYLYCLEAVMLVSDKLQEINKKEYFLETNLEKAINVTLTGSVLHGKKSTEISKSPLPSSVLLLQDSEDFHLEFNGFCAWTLFFADGYLLPGDPNSGIFQYQDQYYSFATKVGCEIWSTEPEYHLMQIYEILRVNPEMIELLNAYDAMYVMKDHQQSRKGDKKFATRTEEVQTVLHPIEQLWDKDYTFSEWELKKRALALSRLIKCVTKSAQTVNHSHYRASIGVLAAPDKDKGVQTKKDSSCVHSTIANYLYGLRGHREDKFKVLTLTRPIEESCEREIILEKGDPCRGPWLWRPPINFVSNEPCPSWQGANTSCDFTCDYSDEYNGEGF